MDCLSGSLSAYADSVGAPGDRQWFHYSSSDMCVCAKPRVARMAGPRAQGCKRPSSQLRLRVTKRELELNRADKKRSEVLTSQETVRGRRRSGFSRVCVDVGFHRPCRLSRPDVRRGRDQNSAWRKY